MRIITFKPLHDFPRKERTDRDSGGRFKASWPDTLSMLRSELDALNARRCVLYADLDPSDLTRDGLPYAHAKGGRPCVILTFEKPTTRNGQTTYAEASFPCDTYWTWQHNVRAIALTLGRLRDVARYGATSDADEQYAGWLRLPGAGGVNTTALQLTPERAARIVVDAHPSAVTMTARLRAGISVGLLGMSVADRTAFAKEARHAAHPDRGGSADAFSTVTEAARVLCGGALP